MELEIIAVFQNWAMQNWKALSWDQWYQQKTDSETTQHDLPVLQQLQEEFFDCRPNKTFVTFVFPQERKYSFKFIQDTLLSHEKLYMNILYIIDQSPMVSGGKCACLYTSPEFGFFRVFFSTNEDGVIDNIYVNIYNDYGEYSKDISSEQDWISNSRITGKWCADSGDVSLSLMF